MTTVGLTLVVTLFGLSVFLGRYKTPMNRD